jgi:hypothetical protein
VRRLTAFLLLLCALSAPADAAWVTQNKKPVSAVRGMQNSIEGAITNVLPWNWTSWGKKKDA